MDQRIRYINNLLKKPSEFVYRGPNYLYKYRDFDHDYNIDAIENDYIFLCRALELDDKDECNSNLSFSEIMDLEKNNLRISFNMFLLNQIKQYCTESDYGQLEFVFNKFLYRNGMVNPSAFLDMEDELKKLAPGLDTSLLLNILDNSKYELNKPEVINNFRKLFVKSTEFKRSLGICSFSEEPNIEQMWKEYAKNYTGFCIEYDVSKYKYNKSILPAIYTKEREFNVVKALISDYVGSLIYRLSGGRIFTDTCMYIRLFLNKDPDLWCYQKEWRLIGDQNKKLISPKINKIILGCNISPENEKRIRDICGKKNILCIKQNSYNIN